MYKIRFAHQYINYQEWSYYPHVIPKQTTIWSPWLKFKLANMDNESCHRNKQFQWGGAMLKNCWSMY